MTRHDEIVAALTGRWPEHRVAPSLERVAALCELLGDPQRATPVIHLTGTNGKGSTAIVIDALLRADGLRVGRFSSPHLQRVNERISIDGSPLSDERFDEIWTEIAPFVQLVDERRIDGVPMTFFEVVTVMAYAAFADAPVDVAVVEVGLGGTWDATNVADGSVAVITPIALDHTHLLGDTLEQIATEKAGIIKPGAHVVLAGQQPEVAPILLARCLEVGALPLAEGADFGVLDRTPAVGGQVLRINTVEGPVGDLHLPLFGAHFAQNAAVGVAAVEAFLGLKGLAPDVIQEGFDAVSVPGRLEVLRRSPTVLVDAAHNPHGARATAEAIEESYAFTPFVGVLAAMRDKDVEGMLTVWEEHLSQVVVTQVSSTDRGMPVAELAELAEQVFGADRVFAAARMDEALEQAVALADAEGAAAPGVVVTGSVVAAGEARSLLRGADDGTEDDDGADGAPILEVGAERFGGRSGADDGDWS